MRRYVRGGRKKKVVNSVNPKINRFPKMMILWKKVSEKVLYPEKDEEFHKSVGYYVATVYAIMKKIGSRRKDIEKELGRKMTRKEKERFHKNLFEPPFEEINGGFWDYVKISNPLHPYMWYRVGKIKGIKQRTFYVFIDGKSVPGNIKYNDQVEKKFGGYNGIYDKYEKYIEKMIEENKEYQDDIFWLNGRWFEKVWKNIRDLNWDEEMDRINLEKKKKVVENGLFKNVVNF